MSEKKRWEQRILEAKARGSFTKADVELASRWVTCACGEQDPSIERDEYGAPRDLELQMLGGKFYIHLKDNQIMAASVTLATIKERSDAVMAASKAFS